MASGSPSRDAGEAVGRELFVPACAVVITKRRRFFWAAWWSAPPCRVPFRAPDASDGGFDSPEAARRDAELRAGCSLADLDGMWARAWLRVLRGELPWPSDASRMPRLRHLGASREPESIWTTLGISSHATDDEIKAAYRAKVKEAHPDHGGTPDAIRKVLRAYDEATRRARRPKPKRRGA